MALCIGFSATMMGPARASAGCQMILPNDPGGKPNTVIFDGCNVEIRNGSGDTETVNGLGNLVVGYNSDDSGVLDRGGSHNIVVGDDHTYSSYVGIVNGHQNRLIGPESAIIGSELSTASGEYSAVVGGRINTASGDYSAAVAGWLNQASGDYSAVTGGAIGQATGTYSWVGAGAGNQASGLYSSITGGLANKSSGMFSAVLGGRNNHAQDQQSVVLGGNAATTVAPDDIAPDPPF